MATQQTLALDCLRFTEGPSREAIFDSLKYSSAHSDVHIVHFVVMPCGSDKQPIGEQFTIEAKIKGIHSTGMSDTSLLLWIKVANISSHFMLPFENEDGEVKLEYSPRTRSGYTAALHPHH